ncbi:MAG: HD domain-containing protein [Bacteroidetes bacterium]|nr:HD domain-containing protein [Fibrella sp.]
MNSQRAETYIIDQLRQGLPPTLTYHSIEHTLDVVRAATQLADAEGITDPDARALLHTAALYHDAGFLSTYADHERAGCTLVRQTLPDFGYTPDQIGQICELIMATRVPQRPQTHLAQILCDADLDYLGRPDVELIARTLFTELVTHRGLTDEPTWNRIQVSFLETHHYWTATAQNRREPAKQTYLDQLRRLIGSDKA